MYVIIFQYKFKFSMAQELLGSKKFVKIIYLTILDFGEPHEITLMAGNNTSKVCMYWFKIE